MDCNISTQNFVIFVWNAQGCPWEKGRVKMVASTSLGQSRGSICAEAIGWIIGVEVILREWGFKEVIYIVAGNSGVPDRRGQRNEQDSKTRGCEREGAQPLLRMESSEESSFQSDEEEGFLNNQDVQMDSKELKMRKVWFEILSLESWGFASEWKWRASRLIRCPHWTSKIGSSYS